MKNSSLINHLFWTLAILLNPSVVLSDIVVTFTPSGNDTQVHMAGSLDVTGVGTGVFSTFASQVRFSSAVTSVHGEVDNHTSHVYPRGSLQPFGAAPIIGPDVIAGIPDDFIVRYFAREINAPGPLPSFVIVPQDFVIGSGADVNHTIVDRSFASLNLTVGDIWGVGIPVLDPFGTETGEFQSLTFRAVPEPSSLWLFFNTAAILLMTRRRSADPII